MGCNKKRFCALNKIRGYDFLSEGEQEKIFLELCKELQKAEYIIETKVDKNYQPERTYLKIYW